MKKIVLSDGVQYIFRIFKFNIFMLYLADYMGWFRLFGAGFLWKNTCKCNLLFSERNKFVKGIRIGKWYIRKIKNYKTY